MLQFLSVVDNPKQDIPLAAVLCSPIVGMTSEELAMVRSANQEEHLLKPVPDVVGSWQVMTKLEVSDIADGYS